MPFLLCLSAPLRRGVLRDIEARLQRISNTRPGHSVARAPDLPELFGPSYYLLCQRAGTQRPTARDPPLSGSRTNTRNPKTPRIRPETSKSQAHLPSTLSESTFIHRAPKSVLAVRQIRLSIEPATLTAIAFAQLSRSTEAPLDPRAPTTLTRVAVRRSLRSNTFYKSPRRLASSIRPSAHRAGWLQHFVSNTFHKPPKRLASSIRPSTHSAGGFPRFVSNTFHKPPKRLASSIRPSTHSAGGPGSPLSIPPASSSRKNCPPLVSRTSALGPATQTHQPEHELRRAHAQRRCVLTTQPTSRTLLTQRPLTWPSPFDLEFREPEPITLEHPKTLKRRLPNLGPEGPEPS